MVPRIVCGGEVSTRVRPRGTRGGRSFGRYADLVFTRLAPDAGANAGPEATPGTLEAGSGPAPDSGRQAPAVSDHGGNAPVFTPSGGSAPQEHGRGPHRVDALAETRGPTPGAPAPRILRGKSPTRPLT
ncbi:ATP-binding protein [Streptomyces sp. WG7]|uniref:ATP-binding protein n=1 Tax=Streptomyces sp. WG7 TaxID=3417650 RepID=UPI003CF9172A